MKKAVLLIISLLILSTPVQTTEAAITFWHFQNRWQLEHYIHNENTTPESGEVDKTSPAAHWELETVPNTEFVRFRNRWHSDHYLHVENGRLESGPIDQSWYSAQWQLELISDTGYLRIRNRWQTGDYLHTESGHLQSGPIEPEWWSAQWLRELAPILSPPPVLSANGISDWERYLRARNPKAFAVTPSGNFTGVGNGSSLEKASSDALANCNGDCEIVSENGLMPIRYPAASTANTPPTLSILGKSEWERYTRLPGAKAFAIGPNGDFGLYQNHIDRTLTPQQIKDRASADCAKPNDCRIIALSNQMLFRLKQLAPPAALSKTGRDGWEEYLFAQGHKAFAMSPQGSWSFRTERSSVESAVQAALDNCSGNCQIVAINNEYTSSQQAPQVTVTFYNKYNAPIKLYWITPTGNERFIRNIDPNGSVSSTFRALVAWRFKKGDEVVGEYVTSGQSQQRYEIADPSQTFTSFGQSILQPERITLSSGQTITRPQPPILFESGYTEAQCLAECQQGTHGSCEVAVFDQGNRCALYGKYTGRRVVPYHASQLHVMPEALARTVQAPVTRTAKVGESCSEQQACGSGLTCTDMADYGTLTGSTAIQGSVCVPSNPTSLTKTVENFDYGSCLAASTGGAIATNINPVTRGARELGATVTLGAGNASAFFLKHVAEAGIIIGPDGELGCYVTTCRGATLNPSISFYTNMGYFINFDNLAGRSIVLEVGTSIPKTKFGISASYVFVDGDYQGFTMASSGGVGVLPVDFSAGTCQTKTLEIRSTLNGMIYEARGHELTWGGSSQASSSRQQTYYPGQNLVGP